MSSKSVRPKVRMSGLPWSVYFGALWVSRCALQRIVEIDIDPGCPNVMLMSQNQELPSDALELRVGLVCQATPDDQKATKISRSRTEQRGRIVESTYAVVGEIKNETLRRLNNY
jgi:hypothetical protein